MGMDAGDRLLRRRAATTTRRTYARQDGVAGTQELNRAIEDIEDIGFTENLSTRDIALELPHSLWALRSL